MGHLLRLLLFLVFLVAVPGRFQAQPLPVSVLDADTVIVAWVPAAAYTTDLGFLGALVFQRIEYGRNIVPFVNFSEVRLHASTKKLFEFRVQHIQTQTLGLPLRSHVSLRLESQPAESYFGWGNQSVLLKESWKDGFYDYEIRRMILSWNGRKNLVGNSAHSGYLDVMALITVSHEQPGREADNLLAREKPAGTGGGWLNGLGAGLIWENRDSEFAATRGNRLEITATWFPGLTGNYSMSNLQADVRQFHTLPAPYFYPVLALRLAGNLALGDVPFWRSPYLGDDETLRGYPLYRFRGNAALYSNLELRTWVYEHKSASIRLGLHGFHDAGRVFSNNDRVSSITRNYHRTIGGGIAIGLFSPDLILRMDLGISEETTRLYMNVGYMF